MRVHKPTPSHFFRGCLLIAALSLTHAPVGAQDQELEDAAAACRDAASLAESGDIDAAVEEARWCLDVLETVASNAALAVFPDALGDWVADELQNQTALGITTLTRDYRRGDQTISMSVTTGPAGAGLAALAQLGARFGAGSGTRFRVQRRPVTDMSGADETVSFIVELRSGGVMNLESTDTAASDVREFLEAFPVADIDDALGR